MTKLQGWILLALVALLVSDVEFWIGYIYSPWIALFWSCVLAAKAWQEYWKAR